MIGQFGYFGKANNEFNLTNYESTNATQMDDDMFNSTSMPDYEKTRESDIPSSSNAIITYRNESSYIANTSCGEGPSYNEGSLMTKKSIQENSICSKVMTNVSLEKVNGVTNVSSEKVNNISKTKKLGALKTSPYCFPSNVKALLATGIFEGVPVKYVSWSREKTLKGIIKGTRYLCGCDLCKMKTGVTAFDFERHAGCETKHPNSHIFFANGKSISAVVQELMATPQQSLFQALKNATGTPVNMKNLLAWKRKFVNHI